MCLGGHCRPSAISPLRNPRRCWGWAPQSSWFVWWHLVERGAPSFFVEREVLPACLLIHGGQLSLYFLPFTPFDLVALQGACRSLAVAVIPADSPGVSSSFSPCVLEQKVNDCDEASGPCPGSASPASMSTCAGPLEELREQSRSLSLVAPPPPQKV